MPGSTSDAAAKGFGPKSLRRPPAPGKSAGTEVTWPRDMMEDIRHLCSKSSVSYNPRDGDFAHFGKLQDSVRRYVRQFRDNVKWDVPTVTEKMTINMLHTAPLGWDRNGVPIPVSVEDILANAV